MERASFVVPGRVSVIRYSHDSMLINESRVSKKRGLLFTVSTTPGQISIFDISRLRAMSVAERAHAASRESPQHDPDVMCDTYINMLHHDNRQPIPLTRLASRRCRSLELWLRRCQCFGCLLCMALLLQHSKHTPNHQRFCQSMSACRRITF